MNLLGPIILVVLMLICHGTHAASHSVPLGVITRPPRVPRYSHGRGSCNLGPLVSRVLPVGRDRLPLVQTVRLGLVGGRLVREHVVGHGGPEPVRPLAVVGGAEESSVGRRGRRCEIGRGDGPDRPKGDAWREDGEHDCGDEHQDAVEDQSEHLRLGEHRVEAVGELDQAEDGADEEEEGGELGA